MEEETHRAVAVRLAEARFDGTFDRADHSDYERDEMRALYFDGYVAEATSDVVTILDALRSLPVEERARAVGLTVHQCRQCGGVGYVADHDTACFGNCERHGCPVQLPCTNCQGLGVELQPDVTPPLAAIEEPF